MKRFRLPILMAVVTMLTLAMSSCSSDDEDGSVAHQDVYYDEESAKNDGISFSFRLKNEKGEDTTKFKLSENIFFDFAIINNCDTTMIYTGDKTEWKEDIINCKVRENGADMLFPMDSEFLCVYSDDGKEIDVPYSSMFCEYVFPTYGTILSHSTHHIRCPWKETGQYNHGDVTYPLCGPKIEQADLPAGKYYVSFSIKYREKANDPDSKFKTVIFKYPFEIV